MGSALFLAKARYWTLPELTGPALAHYAADLAASSHQDVAFAAVTGFVGWLALAASAARPRPRRLAFGAIVAFGTASVAYAEASARIFSFMISPLTHPLLPLAADMTSMRPSLGAFLDDGTARALVAAPVLYLLAVWLSSGWRPLSLRGAAVVTIGLAAWISFGYWIAQGPWGGRFEHWIAASPHWQILSSTVEAVRHPDTPRLEASFEASDLDDFAIPAARTWPLPADYGVASARPSNVIFVVLESTSAEWMSLYGSRHRSTPRLEAEAAHALVFENFYCHAGLSANSMAALTLSLVPYMTSDEYTAEYPELPGASLADVLGPHGYRTAFIHSGEIEYMGQDRFLARRGFGDVWGARQLALDATAARVSPDHILVDAILKWLDADRARPFYVMAWTIEGHWPYDVDPAHAEIDFFQGDEPTNAWDLGRHLNALHDVDEQVGRLIDGLRERGLADDTLIVFTGDHGEGFGAPNYSWGHGDRLYQADVRVPLMLWNPRLFPQARRSPTVGGHVDLNPTVAGLLGLPPHPSWQGRSLFDPGRSPRTYFYAARDGYLLGVREGRWKYILDTTRGRQWLYDLGRDPAEQVDQAAAHPETARLLRRRLAAWRHHVAHTLRERRAGRFPFVQAEAPSR